MRPERPPVFDPHDPRYWDEGDLDGELSRVFSICHSCRMCVGYCPSFPALFERVDRNVRLARGEVETLERADFHAVNDLCFQCKACHFKCPYTRDDAHPFDVDVPRMLLRLRAQRTRREGLADDDRFLAEPERLGRLVSGALAPLANRLGGTRVARALREQLTSISAEFPVPPFARETFADWFATHPRKNQESTRRVVLFATCCGNYNLPAASRAAVQVLEHHGVRVDYASEQTCCGMPNLDAGDMPAALAKAERNVRVLHEFVAAGADVVVTGPTCSYVLRHEYPQLLGTAGARAVAAHTYDSMQYVRCKLLREGHFRTDFEAELGEVVLHAPCHLRAQKIGTPALHVLRKLPRCSVQVIEQCSAVDGTWGMKARYFELGRRYAQKLLDEARAAGEHRVLASDCPLAAQRLAGELGRAVVHPMELLNLAYGLPAVGPLPAEVAQWH